ARPPLLERAARHDAVLHGEETEQKQIDDQRLPERSGSTCVDRLRNEDVADEPDRIEKRREEEGIHRQAVQQRQKSSHHNLLRLLNQSSPRRGEYRALRGSADGSLSRSGTARYRRTTSRCSCRSPRRPG